MLRNYLAAALRNLARNRLYSAITIASLAIGFTGVILATVFWRYETSYDRFWPNAERVYLVGSWFQQPRSSEVENASSRTVVADFVKDEIPGAEVVARTAPVTLQFEHGNVSGEVEYVHWAEQALFEVLRPKVVEGSLAGALAAPGSVVLTKSVARKYFGGSKALGQLITVTERKHNVDTRTTVRVTAVVEDTPANSHMYANAFISGEAPTSRLHDPADRAFVYVLTRPGVSAASFQAALDGITARHLGPTYAPGYKVWLRSVPLTQIYMKPQGYYGGKGHSKMSSFASKDGERSLLWVATVLAGLVLTVAAINFVTLMTARGAGRAVEVGVRKSVGARRRDLVVQFLGESLIYTLLAFVVSLATAELAAPVVNAFTGSTLRVNYVDQAGPIGMLFAAALVIGVLAGLYPAIALSSFRPAAVLKGGPVRTPGSSRIRQALIVLQFMPLILLALASSSMLAQARAGTLHSRQLMPGDPLIVWTNCTAALKAQLQTAPGVRSVSCIVPYTWRSNTLVSLVLGAEANGDARTDAGQEFEMTSIPVTNDVLAFHGLSMLAGETFPEAGGAPSTSGPGVILNDYARRKFGYPNPAAALGRTVSWTPRGGEPKSGVVIGVVAERPGMEGHETWVLTQAGPDLVQPGIGVRLQDGDHKENLAAIDRILKDFGGGRLVERRFWRDEISQQAAEFGRTLAILSAAIGIGIMVAAIGLFGLAAFLAEQRTKEIGVRKAMGASRTALMKLLLFQFARPVLIANIIVCPLALIFATSITRGDGDTADQMPYGPEVFVPVIIGSLAIAIAATFVHAWQVTRAKPVTALRYE